MTEAQKTLHDVINILRDSGWVQNADKRGEECDATLSLTEYLKKYGTIESVIKKAGEEGVTTETRHALQEAINMLRKAGSDGSRQAEIDR